MDGEGGWKTQPIILVEGRRPFFADTPQEYIAELERLHDDLTLVRGPFFLCIGQFKDGLENAWQMKQKAAGTSRNGHEEAVHGKEGANTR